MAEVGRVEDGHAEELERRIVVCEIVIGLIVDYRSGLELPESGARAGSSAQSSQGENTAFRITVRLPSKRLALPATIRELSVNSTLRRRITPLLKSPVSSTESANNTSPPGSRSATSLVGDHHAIALPVADARGTQNALALGDLDIAGCDDRIGVFVISQLIGGHQEIACEQVIDAQRGVVSLLCARLQRGEGQETRENEWHEGLNPHFLTTIMDTDALRVAPRRPPASLRASTVFPDTLFGPLLADRAPGRDAGRDRGE